jgi:hypothetical protein
MGSAPEEGESLAPTRSRQATSDLTERPAAQRPAPPAGRPPPPTDVLAEDGKKFVGVSRRKQEQLARGDDETTRKNMKYESLTAGVDGIMEIPELEEEGREDLSAVVRCGGRAPGLWLDSRQCAHVAHPHVRGSAGRLAPATGATASRHAGLMLVRRACRWLRRPRCGPTRCRAWRSWRRTCTTSCPPWTTATSTSRCSPPCCAPRSRCAVLRTARCPVVSPHLAGSLGSACSLRGRLLSLGTQVQEAEEPWDPDIILTEVASALYAEREKAEGVEGGEENGDLK